MPGGAGERQLRQRVSVLENCISVFGKHPTTPNLVALSGGYIPDGKSADGSDGSCSCKEGFGYRVPYPSPVPRGGPDDASHHCRSKSTVWWEPLEMLFLNKPLLEVHQKLSTSSTAVLTAHPTGGGRKGEGAPGRAWWPWVCRRDGSLLGQAGPCLPCAGLAPVAGGTHRPAVPPRCPRCPPQQHPLREMQHRPFSKPRLAPHGIPMY